MRAGEGLVAEGKRAEARDIAMIELEGQAEPERSTSDLNQEKESKSEENREDSGKPDEEEDGSETNSNEEVRIRLYTFLTTY